MNNDNSDQLHRNKIYTTFEAAQGLLHTGERSVRTIDEGKNRIETIFERPKYEEPRDDAPNTTKPATSDKKISQLKGSRRASEPFGKGDF